VEGQPSAWTGHVIVCGLHDVGMRVVEQLHAAGERVIVLDDDPDQPLLRLVTGWGVTHLAGSGRRPTTLAAAGISKASALLCTASNDLDNLEIALLARRIRPDLRIVVQLGNEAVGRAVERVTGPGTVLDVAGLAAPTFAEACLDIRSRSVDIAGEPFVLQELVVTSPGTLRELFGDLAPIAVVPADGTQMQVCPGRDLSVEVGDRVMMLGTETGLAERRLPATATITPRRRHNPVATARRYVAGFVAEADRPLRLAVGTLFGLALLSVLLLKIGYRRIDGSHMSLIDSTYFTTETLTTVGFGDFYFANQPTWLRTWAILLMVIGATVVTVLYAMLTNLLVSRRIAQSLGRQLATRMVDHVILVGLGSVGLRVLEQLVAAGQHVVVLERDEDNRFLARARALGVPIVFGDSTVPASLDAVNLRSARAVAVLTSSDLANIETGLAVDDLLGERRSVVPVVLRVFDRDLAHTIEASFGFHYVRSTAALAAPWFVGAALGLSILSTFYVDHQPMMIGRLTVGETGGLRGKTMLELSASIRVIAISRRHSEGRLEYPPRRDTRFDGGDQAYLVGPYEELLQVLRRDQAAG
jgi:Trk K+ transport system NAD-binding subunit